jgi:hypothetical protein
MVSGRAEAIRKAPAGKSPGNRFDLGRATVHAGWPPGVEGRADKPQEFCANADLFGEFVQQG